MNTEIARMQTKVKSRLRFSLLLFMYHPPPFAVSAHRPARLLHYFCANQSFNRLESLGRHIRKKQSRTGRTDARARRLSTCSVSLPLENSAIQKEWPTHSNWFQVVAAFVTRQFTSPL